jgi:cell division protease FtsH
MNSVQKFFLSILLAGSAFLGAQTPTFDSVAGLDEAKKDLGDIVRYLKNPKQFSALGAKVPRGLLLVGPPGNGKTMLARALAVEAGCSFISTSGSEFVEKFVGVGAARVRELFDEARSQSPCIIFIDEIDALGGKRSGRSDGSREYDHALNQLLTEMDGFERDEDIFVVGATNRVDVLDSALLRPGRFDKRVYIGNPGLKARKEILTLHAQSIMLARDVDFMSLAHGTVGMSGADLANLVNQATLHASRNNQNMVTKANFEAALDIILLGDKTSIELSPKEKRVVAFHEAGHALINILLESTTHPLHKVTIEPRDESLGVSISRPTQDQYMSSQQELESRIMVCMGGRAAEELMFQTKMSGAASDFQEAMRLARIMVCQYGMHPDVGLLVIDPHGGLAQISQETRRKIDRAIVSVLTSCYTRAKDLLQKHKNKLEMLAHELLAKTTLTAEQVYGLLEMG